MQIPSQPHGLTRMRKDLTGPLMAPVWPKGVALATFDAGRHRLAAHDLLVEAYRLGGGSVADCATWWEALHHDAEFDPHLFFVVLDGPGRVVALAQCWTVPFVKDLAVAETYRRRGLGEALLRHVFLAFRARGAGFVDLKVQHGNPSGAERLYLRVGMTPQPLE